MAVPEGLDLFFFEQTCFRRLPKRCRKLPEELPHSLRFAHLSPKVAAFLASKEKLQRPPDEEDSLSKTSLMPEITHSFHNVKNRLDALMENDEDSQRYLFEEARMSAPNILLQLAKFLYVFEDIHSCIPKSLEYLLLMGWKEMTVDIIIVPREWQTLAMREAHASSSAEQVDEDRDPETDNVKSKSHDKHHPDMAKTKKKSTTSNVSNKLGLSEIAEDGEQAQKTSPSTRRLEAKERFARNLQTKPPRYDRMKSVYAESQAGVRSPGNSQRGHPDDRSVSTVRDTPSELRFGHNPYFSSVIQFQLSSKACEDKGWILSQDGVPQDGLDQNTALEWSVHILRAAMKLAKEDQTMAGDSDLETIVNLRYYGDTLQNQVNKYKSNKQSANPVHRGEKPRIPSMYRDEKNEGRKLMQTTISDGSTTIFYPSGRPAVVTSQAGFGRPGSYTLAYEDEADGKLLACFTPSGKGVCYHGNGVIRFVATEKGGHLAGTEGRVIRKWKWPLGGLKLSTAVAIQLNNQLGFRCYSQCTMLLLYSCQKEMARFPVGPVYGAVEPKPGDEEQLLTSYAFTSKTAADLMKIFAPKKPAPKTKKKKERVKPHVAEFQMMFDDTMQYDIAADKDLSRLQHKVRWLVDDWMEHYRIAVGMSSISLHNMKETPQVRQRNIQSAKCPATVRTSTSKKASEVEIATADPLVKLRAPSAPAFSEVRERLLSRAQSNRAKSAGGNRQPTAEIQFDSADQDEQDAGGDTENIQPSHARFTAAHSAPGTRPPHSASRSKSARTHLSHTAPASKSDCMIAVPVQLGFCPTALRAELLGYERPLCKCSRHHIPYITDIEYDEFIASEVPRNQMLIVSVVSTLFPESSAGEVMIEQIYVNQNKNRTRPCVTARHDPVRILCYDVASAAYDSDHVQPLLLARHNVVPGMFLMYQNGNLLFCDHIFNGYGNARKDFRKQIMKTRYDAIHSRYLPKDFRFSPGRGRTGRRAAWGGQIGGAGVDHYGSPGTTLDPTMTAIGHRPESASTTSTERQLKKLHNPKLKSIEPMAKFMSLSLTASGCQPKMDLVSASIRSMVFSSIQESIKT